MSLTGDTLDLGPSARGLGLGGAFTALVDDATAVIHNPAALGWQTGVGLSSFYARQFGGITYGSLSLAMPWFGLNAAFVDSGLIEGDTPFRYASQAFAAAAGVPLGPFGFGARWRYFRTSSPSTGAGWSLDPAILLDLESIRAAMLVESIASQSMTYASGAEEAFETSVRIGVAAMLSPAPDVWWNAAFEVVGLLATQTHIAAGLEAWLGGLGARVGFDGVGPTFGLSVRFNGIQFDWAYAMRSDLGNSHRASLNFQF